MNLILTSNGLSSIICSADECLCWIIVLLNILTIFYLVFCAWFKVTKTVRIAGYVWASALAVGSITVLPIHTCIFTILSTVFSGLVIMAVLSVAFNKGAFANDDEEERPQGSYVVHKTDAGNFTFVVYDNKKQAIAKSCFKYASIDEAKAAINACRKNGSIASIEDRTQSWIEFVNYPKFELVNDNGKFSFSLAIGENSKVIKSESFDEYEECKKAMKKTASAVKTTKVYFAEHEVLLDNMFDEPNKK